jgi:hypothetical protein
LTKVAIWSKIKVFHWRNFPERRIKMEVTQVTLLIDKRRGEKSYEDFARTIGIKTGALYRILTKQRDLSVKSVQQFAEYFAAQGDMEIVNALARYTLGLEVEVKIR